MEFPILRYERGCPTCGVEVYTRLLKRNIRDTKKKLEYKGIYICQKCAAKLHFGKLEGYEKYTPKDEIPVQGKKFQVKKGIVVKKGKV